MRHLVNISVYAFNKSYDYQSVCEPGAAPKQGAGHRSAYVVSNVPTPVPLQKTLGIHSCNDCFILFSSRR